MFAEEEAAGRFHASIAFTSETFDSVGGWPLTKRGDFDQTFLKHLTGAVTTADPSRARSPSYVFRWGSTGAYHGQGLMQGPSDFEWYERVSDGEPIVAMATIVPGIDTKTVRVFDIVPLDRFAIVK